MRAFGECQPISGVGVTDMVDTSSYYGWPEFHQQDDIGLRPAVGGPRFASLRGRTASTSWVASTTQATPWTSDARNLTRKRIAPS